MVFDSFKRMLGIRSKAATRNSEERNRVRDIRSSVSILQDKIEQLHNFENACDEAGLKDDLENAALSAHAFATACLAFINARGKSDQATKGIRSQYKEVTSNLMMLAISTNSAGINLQTEARDISNTINNLMENLGLPRE